MRLKLHGLILLVLSLVTQMAWAIPPMPPKPLKNLEIAGQVLQDGKPLANARVKAYFYHCDTKLQASATSNKGGYYRLVIPSYPRAMYFAQPLPPAELMAFKKKYPKLRPRFIRGYKPVPIVLSTQSPAKPTAKICQQALKGGLETPLQNRFNLKLDGVPATTPTPPTPPKPPVASEQQKCQAQGGKWEFISRGVKGCNLSYKDAGRLCTDGKQCSSQVCLAKDRNPRASEGQCAANTFSIINGCMGEIKRGRWHSRACP